MKPKLLMKLSMIIDKMEIKNDLISMEAKTNEEMGKYIISLIVAKIWKVEKEVYELIAEHKGITIEEAQEIDIIEFVKDLSKIDGLKSFLV